MFCPANTDTTTEAEREFSDKGHFRMTEFERTIWDELTRLKREVELLKAGAWSADKAIEFDRLPRDATVGVEYIAWRFGCSINQVKRHEAGTYMIKLKSRKPIKAEKFEVDKAWREYKQPTSEKAAEIRAKAKQSAATETERGGGGVKMNFQRPRRTRHLI